jgi:hypothetical protein
MSELSSDSGCCFGGKVYFGETYNGQLPRAYVSSEDLFSCEGITPGAIIRNVGVYSSNLVDDDLPSHFVVSHWWVLFDDSDGNCWSAENVGGILLQRIDSMEDGKRRRKDIGKRWCEFRGTNITKLQKTAARGHRTMGETMRWIFSQKDKQYHALWQNCHLYQSQVLTLNN